MNILAKDESDNYVRLTTLMAVEKVLAPSNSVKTFIMALSKRIELKLQQKLKQDKRVLGFHVIIWKKSIKELALK